MGGGDWIEPVQQKIIEVVPEVTVNIPPENESKAILTAVITGACLVLAAIAPAILRKKKDGN